MQELTGKEKRCVLRILWVTVTYNPTFASGKSITFVMSASDLKNS